MSCSYEGREGVVRGVGLGRFWGGLRNCIDDAIDDAIKRGLQECSNSKQALRLSAFECTTFPEMGNIMSREYLVMLTTSTHEKWLSRDG